MYYKYYITEAPGIGLLKTIKKMDLIDLFIFKFIIALQYQMQDYRIKIAMYKNSVVVLRVRWQHVSTAQTNYL